MPEERERPPAVIVDTTDSPYAHLDPVRLHNVRLVGAFWEPRRERNRERTLRAQYKHLEQTGRLDNFRRAAGELEVDYQGLVFNDSDVYKWLEAASWTLATEDDPELSQMVDETIDLVASAQAPDGYLNTYFTFERADERWSNLRDLHELYCAGHLFQAAVAHYRATGKTRLLTVARRFADLICETFGPGEDQRQGVPGHPEIEMALVELARATGISRYLTQAAYFVDARGHGLIGGSSYHQDHIPFREMPQLTGHAVRAAYLTAGATDIYAEMDGTELRAALERLWQEMIQHQIYIAGGLGGRHQGEAIGADYELPNARAYAETCAGIANVMWAWRMLQLDGDARYAGLMERALYNAVLPGISLDGTAYYYVNPLATDGQPRPGDDRGDLYRRQPWYRCACCPPNIARTLAKLPGYLYSTTPDDEAETSSDGVIWVHHYAANQAELALPSGETVELVQRTRYPWDGTVILETLTPGTYALRVRIPDWCETEKELDRPTVSVNGDTSQDHIQPGTYFTVRRTWTVGDAVCLQLPMPIRRVTSHPYILENTDRVALMRGPLLYCLEAADHPGVDLRDIMLPDEAEVTSTFRTDLLGGVQVIEGEALVAPPAPGWQSELYRPIDDVEPTSPRPIQITAIPYFAWANREPGAMQVWLRRE